MLPKIGRLLFWVAVLGIFLWDISAMPRWVAGLVAVVILLWLYGNKGARAMRPKIEFEVGEPVTVTLCYPQGREFPSRFYSRWPGDSVSFVFTAEEGVFYVPEDAGGLLNARLRSLGVVAGDTITITKRRVPNPNTDRPVTEYFCASGNLTKPNLAERDMTPRDRTAPR